jgi:hypothetical protein
MIRDLRVGIPAPAKIASRPAKNIILQVMWSAAVEATAVRQRGKTWPKAKLIVKAACSIDIR